MAQDAPHRGWRQVQSHGDLDAGHALTTQRHDLPPATPRGPTGTASWPTRAIGEAAETCGPVASKPTCTPCAPTGRRPQRPPARTSPCSITLLTKSSRLAGQLRAFLWMSIRVLLLGLIGLRIPNRLSEVTRMDNPLSVNNVLTDHT